ncbi:dTDP-4-dehydrorhamnose reductase [Desulfuromonas sp. KJ2020]|uniref:dTDP-4-dehydrorhamnose reductase n=1 Tax=Desulfuromonas sp. KJ2020 TaxID=2919173 RepID=UPI0020A7658B|nr:dTDP-4-dehydrorhamnose reductase [Desulfuromonas sp. KJ2020]MCP3177571.1 dTDP-4-dehydrorhamnose reductase [Desulfuromonas sp. KJ2020]
MTSAKRKLALLGANGMLATAIKKLAPINCQIQSYDLPDFDITNRTQVLALQDSVPDIILNCAAYTNVDGCETQHELAMQVNGEGPGLLAQLASAIDAVLVHVSTDFVFSGDKREPYHEEDPTGPLSVYGQSKFLGEQRIIESGLKKYFIVRTSWLYGLGGSNFVETMIRLAKERTELKVVDDQRGTPTWTDDLAEAIFTLLTLVDAPHASPLTPPSPYGLYHFSNEGACSWYQFAAEIIAQASKSESLKVENILPIPTEEYPLPAHRPKYSVLSKEKYKVATGMQVPEWRESLRKYFGDRTHRV